MTSITIHDVTTISAHTVQGGNVSPHLTIKCEARDWAARNELTLYISDAILTERLITAINQTVADRRAELALTERSRPIQLIQIEGNDE